MDNQERYVDFKPDGSTEGKHPDTIAAEDFHHTKAGFAAIRVKCLDCAHIQSEVRKCVSFKCPLWPFRLGRNPKALKIDRGKA